MKNKQSMRWPLLLALGLGATGLWLLFSALSCSNGDAPPTERTEAIADWCAPHEVPESECTLCNPELIPAFKAKGDWCAEHGIPESQCVLCDPSRRRTPPAGVAAALEGSPQVEEAAAAGSADGGAFCSEHRVLEAECAICLPSLAEALAPGEVPGRKSRGPLVRLATVEAASKAGIRAVRAAGSGAGGRVSVLAEVAFDEDRFARVSCPVEGTVESFSVDLGQRVRAGQVVAVLRSSDVARARADAHGAQARLQLAETEHGRRVALREKGLLPERELLESERELTTARAEGEAAERRLHVLGAEGAGDGEPTPSDRLLLRAPIDGSVVRRSGNVGQIVDVEETLLEIAETSSWWVNLDVPEGLSADVRVGQEIQLAVDAHPGIAFGGSVIAVGGAVDPGTRTLRARARVADGERLLKANLFGTATFALGSAAAASVPREALQYVENVPVVFVRLEDDLFETRAIQAGASRDGRLPIFAGVEPNEEVVTDGSFLLKTQISKGSIGAGCCDVVESLGRRR
jgi:cobalt-zinc-cadmium efflux system membrane fusion protein